MRRRLITILLLSTITLTSLPAFDAGSLQFNRLSVENGLPHNVVHKICRDRKGYLWIATAYGLCRFDGYQMKTFLKEDLDVGTNYISNLLIDRCGNLWICSGEGVSVHDPHLQRFTNINSIAGTDIRGNVTEIFEDTDGTVFIGVNEQGIYAVNPEDWTFGHHFFEDGKQTLPANVSAMILDSSADVRIIGLYNNDLYVADSTMTSLKPFRTRDGRAPFLGKSIKHILPSSSGKYYVSYSVNDICRINPFTMEFEKLDIPIEGAVRLKVMQFIDKNILAIASNNRLFFYNVSTGELQNLRCDENNRWGIPGNNIIYIGGDLKDCIMLGTFNDGLAIQHTPDVGFQRFDKCGRESLAGCRVSGFAQDSRGTVYISTEQAGLLTFSEKDRTVRPFPHKTGLHSLSGVFADGDFLWVMSSVGIDRFNLKTGIKSEYLRNKVDNYTLYRDRDGRLLLGTTLGIEVFDPQTDSFRHLPIMEGCYICDMLEDNRGRMWYATYADGIFIQDGDSLKQLTAENSDLPTNKNLTLFLDSRGSVWVRTYGEGVLRIDDDGIAVYNKENALTSDVAYAMAEDSSGSIWVTSDKGLTVISNIGENVHFTMSDGLLNPGFTARAAFTTASGNLLMGSRDGFVMYNPENFVKDTAVPGLEISEFRLSNNIVLPGDDTGILERSIAETGKIVLSPDQNSFGFTFSLIDSNASGSGDIFYMLEGYDDSWHNAGSDRLVNFVKVPPGEYNLLVKGVNGKGIWNTFCPPLSITVRPQFRQTAASKAILAAVFLLVLLAALTVYRKRLERKRREQEIKMKIDLNNEKVNFFMTIAHEIKTPLTLIRTPLDSILGKEDLDTQTREELGIIDRNTGYLTQLIGELLDFTRLEQKGYTLSCSALNLCDEVEFILFNYRNAFEKKGVRLEYDISEAPVPVWADKAGLAKIINNLLSNALRHAKSYTTVKVTSLDGCAVLSCKNDGSVVPQEQREKIFDSFVQYRDKEGKFTEGFGIGLSVSKTLASLHSGTLGMDDDLTCNNFILKLPLYESQDSVPAQQKPQEDENAWDNGKETIMIVEDNEELREYVRKKLSAKYNVLSARNGREAMDIIEKTCCIDLVVTDISMPVMDGLELCRRIKEDFTYSHILVVILSANLTGQLKISSMDKGADMIVEKPFSMDYLISCIDGLIHNRKMIMERVRNNTPEVESSEIGTSAMSSRDELLIRMMDKCISDNLSDPDFSLDRLSEMLKMSKSTLNRKMKDLLGSSPNDYIRDRRLTKAEEMLSNSVERVNEICWAVGFQTPSYFIKCFRKKYGMSPTEYVRNRTKNLGKAAD